MRKIIIAAAPITKEKFHPVCAEFPISDKQMLDCIGSQEVTNSILEAACKMLGQRFEECVAGIYYVMPDRANRPFEIFMEDLRRKHKAGRAYLEWQRNEILRQRRHNTFCTILTL